MSTKGKILTGIGAVLLLALIVWAVRSVPDVPNEGTTEPTKVMKYSDNTISAEKNGRTIWKLSAEYMEMETDTQNASFTNASATFYQEDGRTAVLTAPHGYYDAQSKNLKIDGGVNIKTSDGAELTCNELDWTDADGMLAAVGEAKVVKEADALLGTGERIESTDGFNKFKIKGSDKQKAHLAKGSAGQNANTN